MNDSMKSKTASAFFDELEKISSRLRKAVPAKALEKVSKRKIRMTVEQMARHAKRIDPLFGGKRLARMEARPDAVRRYRSVVRSGTALTNPDQELTLARRLSMFKKWKATGRTGIGDGGRATLTRSNEPIVLYSGGGLKALAGATKNPAGAFDKPQYIPGSTKWHMKGMYGAPDFAYARRYVGKSTIPGDVSAIARIEVPRKYVPMTGGSAKGGGEAFLTEKALRAAKVKILPKAEAEAAWTPEWRKFRARQKASK
jgi:hypothetical protein